MGDESGDAERSDPVDILLVEDNHGDVNLIERAFDRRSLPGRLHDVQTGEQALDWLHRRGEFADAPRPDLILLDLNLPATSGQAVLEAIDADPRLRPIPVVVLTGSKSDDDVHAAYEAGANAYLVKPVDPTAFADLVELTANFWTMASTLPPAPGSPDER